MDDDWWRVAGNLSNQFCHNRGTVSNLLSEKLQLLWRDNSLNWLFNFQRAESYKRWHEDWWKQKFKFKQEVVVHVLLPHWLYGISIDSDPLFIQQQLSEYVVFPLFLLGCFQGVQLLSVVIS